MKILFLAAEATPFIKVGGLADVAGELPHALAQMGLDVRLCIPFHSKIDRRQFQLTEPLVFPIKHGSMAAEARIFETRHRGVGVWLIDGPPVQAAPEVYGEVVADASKYIFTNLAALQACDRVQWIPDIVHANDWHTAAAVMQLVRMRAEMTAWRHTRSLFTVHNLPYMGAGAQEVFIEYGIPAQGSPLIPDNISTFPLPQGVLQADWVSTVSPTYAKEIRTPEYGAGLQSLIEARSDTLSGIINGIDPEVWDPASDEAIAQVFDAADLSARKANKRALQNELKLEDNQKIPLFGLVSRLDAQKGLDLLWPAIDGLGDHEWQLVLLGMGDPVLERQAREFAEQNPDRVKVNQSFDPIMARKIYAGCDMLLIPSRYEPCGLAQLIAMRYGCVPIARATGGLRDTVVDANLQGDGTGFTFENVTVVDFLQAIKNALRIFEQPELWVEIQRKGMAQDFSWIKTASDYYSLYHKIRGMNVP